MSETPTPETDKKQNWDRPDNDEWRWIVPSWFARRLERERDEAMNALQWIAGAYCHEKTTFQLAQAAYEMSSKARWTIQKIEQKEEA